MIGRAALGSRRRRWLEGARSRTRRSCCPPLPWGAGAYDVNLLGRGRVGGRAVVRLSLYEPTTPAWYTVTLDRATLRTLTVDMTATAHFMRDRYVVVQRPAPDPPAASATEPSRTHQSARVSADGRGLAVGALLAADEIGVAARRGARARASAAAARPRRRAARRRRVPPAGQREALDAGRRGPPSAASPPSATVGMPIARAAPAAATPAGRRAARRAARSAASSTSRRRVGVAAGQVPVQERLEMQGRRGDARAFLDLERELARRDEVGAEPGREDPLRALEPRGELLRSAAAAPASRRSATLSCAAPPAISPRDRAAGEDRAGVGHACGTRSGRASGVTMT